MGKEILNISCPSCGSPAKFDIVHQIYRCASCGGKVKIEKARQNKLEFQENQRIVEVAQELLLGFMILVL